MRRIRDEIDGRVRELLGELLPERRGVGELIAGARIGR